MLDALRARRVQAGVIVRNDWGDRKACRGTDRIELWLSNRIQPAAAGRLRAEISFSMLQLQVTNRAAAAGPFASILLDVRREGDLFRRRAR